jgi:hypothetical protein
MLGYTSEHFFSSGHVICPLLRPAMAELFDQFKPIFLANAEYRFRNRKQFGPISAHDHLLLKSDRAQVVKPSDSAHFSVRYCRTASREALEGRLRQLSDGAMRACINYLEAVVDKVPDAMDYLSKATGPAAPFEKPRTEAHASPSRSSRLPGSDRRWWRVRARCSRNRVTAVMRKQLRGQIVRQPSASVMRRLHRCEQCAQ